MRRLEGEAGRMADLALGSENDSTGDQRFFPTSEPGFDGSKLIDVREPRQSETVPWALNDGYN